MIAVGLTLALFLLWTLVGFGVAAALLPRRNPLQNLLLAPIVGLAVTVLSVFLLNRLGIPVIKFGPWLGLGLAAIAAGLLAWKRPETPILRYGPFAGVFLLALFLTGRPLLEFGFDWLSYCNDDMANYCLGAERMLQHGFTDVPDKDELLDGRDYSQCYWFMYVPDMVRPGSEILLAWVCSVTRLTPHQVFMPVILAFHLILLSTAGALVCQVPEDRGKALLTCLLLGLSALNSLGTIYQLIAQVFGIALLAGCCAVILRPYKDLDLRSGLRLGGLAAVMTTAVFVVYPEVFPFLAIALVLYLGLAWWKKDLAWKPLLAAFLATVAGGLILLNTYIASPVMFLYEQVAHTGSGSSAIVSDLFPYYLMPSGLGNFWGLVPIGGNPADLGWLSARILLGACLLLATLVAAAVGFRRAQPAAILTVVMFGLAVNLFVHYDGFALFKLAMFLQPFVLGTLATVWCSQFRSRWLRVVPLLILGLLGAQTQRGYVEASRGIGALFSEVPDATQSHIVSDFRQCMKATPAKRVVLDSFNSSLIKFQALYTRGVPTSIPGINFFRYISRVSPDPRKKRWIDAKTLAVASDIDAAWVDVAETRVPFDMHDPDKPDAVNTFVMTRIGRPEGVNTEGCYLVTCSGKQTIINRRRTGLGGNFVIRPWNEVHNHLILTASDLGRHYYTDLEGDPPMAMFQLEGDRMLSGKTMQACGRTMLFEVVNPTPKVRVMVDLSTTVKGDGDNRLPPAVVVGADRQAFPLVGRGSARVFSPPMSPQEIQDLHYIAIDMGMDGVRNPYRKTELMRLYGKELPLDRRKFVYHGRDISLVSEEEYAGLKPPSNVEHFPGDLEHSDLEYSGIYEDGWCSEALYCQLAQPEGRCLVVVKGLIPQINDPDFTTDVVVTVDGREVARRTLKPGYFEIAADPPAGGGRRKVEVHFSKFQRLPNGDDRPAGAQLDRIGFLAIPDGVARP